MVRNSWDKAEDEPMEVSVSQYGEMVFRLMVGVDSQVELPDHWESIKGEAIPLVKQLLALNDKMSNGGYKITGYVKEGKKVLSAHKRIELAKDRSWGVKAESLQEGDMVWLHKDYEIPMEDFFSDPIRVEIIKNGRIIVEHPQDPNGMYEIGGEEMVLKAPTDWYDKQSEYRSDEYWLGVADKLDL